MRAPNPRRFFEQLSQAIERVLVSPGTGELPSPVVDIRDSRPRCSAGPDPIADRSDRAAEHREKA